MSDFTADSIAKPSISVLFRPFIALWNGLIYLAESSERARALEEIAQYTDEDLEKMGITRLDLILRTLPNAYLL